MRRRHRRPVASPEAGITLAEVMIVVLIVGILVAIGLPSFLGARERSQDAQASASLRIATNAGLLASDVRSNFLQATPAALAGFEPGLRYLDPGTASTGPDEVSVDATQSNRWVAAVRSDSGRCFAVVVGRFGQVDVEPPSCAAGDVTTEAPTIPTGVVTHQGSVGAVTPGMCLVSVNGYLEQQPCSSSLPQLTLTAQADDYVTLSASDGFCFGTVSPTRGARLVEKICDLSDDQLWTVVPSFEGTVQLKNKETGYCMDVNGFSSNAGARIIQWGYGDPPDATCKSTTSSNNHNFSFV